MHGAPSPKHGFYRRCRLQAVTPQPVWPLAKRKERTSDQPCFRRAAHWCGPYPSSHLLHTDCAMQIIMTATDVGPFAGEDECGATRQIIFDNDQEDHSAHLRKMQAAIWGAKMNRGEGAMIQSQQQRVGMQRFPRIWCRMRAPSHCNSVFFLVQYPSFCQRAAVLICPSAPFPELGYPASKGGQIDGRNGRWKTCLRATDSLLDS